MSTTNPNPHNAVNRRGALISNGQITPPDTPTTPATCTFTPSPRTAPTIDALTTHLHTTRLSSPDTAILPVLPPAPRAFTPPDPFTELSIGRRLADGQWSVVHEASTSPSAPYDAGNIDPSDPAPARTLYAAKIPRGKRAITVLNAEARMLEHITSHPDSARHIVTFHGWSAGPTALVLELLPRTLEDWVASANALPAPARRSAVHSELLTHARALVAGLAWLHAAAGVVHGDIKPGNILLRPSSHSSSPAAPVFCDFSASRLTHPSFPPPVSSAGTYDFMAPEQFGLAAPGNWPTPASDVFALGVTLVYAVVGASPYARAGNVFVRRAMASGGLVEEGVSMDEGMAERWSEGGVKGWVGGALERRTEKRWGAGEWRGVLAGVGSGGR